MTDEQDQTRDMPELGGSGASIPKQIGQYKIKRIIASGGMGTVYEGLQENPRRTVAIKVIKQNMASDEAVRRFQQESQALARMRHPGIAQIYESGTHTESGASTPFFALEYVPNAKTLIQYAKTKHLGLSEKLDLFLQVCDAVHYGHQRGIIHRDLKPANILVDSEGRARIIDFGVARTVDSDLKQTDFQTRVGQIVGTAQYMSPEQFEADPNDLDTRSDVYALGVVLYELLAGVLPYDIADSGIFEIARTVKEDAPNAFNSSHSELQGEVEAIVFKALKKDREYRYQSAFGFAEDIRRYLKGEAISAKPTSLSYQFKVFARRNKTVVTLASAAVILLIAGVVATTTLYFNVKDERIKAEAATERALAANDFLTNTLSAAVSPGYGDVKTIGDICDMASMEIDDAFPSDPLTEAEVRETLGDVYKNLQRTTEAEIQLRKVYEIRKDKLGPSHILTLEALRKLRRFFRVFGYDDEVLEISRLILVASGEIYSTVSEEYLDTKLDLISALVLTGSIAEAKTTSAETLESVLKLGDKLSEIALYARTHDIWIQLRLGDYAQAEDNALELFQETLKQFGESSPSTRGARNSLSAVYIAQGKVQKAKTLYDGKRAPETLGIEIEFQGSNKDMHQGIKFIVFFETWCPFSQVYIPKVQKIHSQYQSLDVDVLGLTRVNRSSSDAKVQQFVEQNKLSFNVLKENGRAWNYFDCSGTPTTIILHDGDLIWESAEIFGVTSGFATELLEGLLKNN